MEDWTDDNVEKISIMLRDGTVPLMTLEEFEQAMNYGKRIIEIREDGKLQRVIPFENITEIVPIWKVKEHVFEAEEYD